MSLNTQDIKSATKFVVKGGKDGEVTAKDFEKIFEAKARAAGLLAENESFQKIKESAIAKAGSDTTRNLLDMDGDGKVDEKDMEIMYQRYMEFLDKNASTFDAYIPFAGQCLFGVGVGYMTGYFARSLYSYKIPIVICSVGLYSGFQYAVQQQFVNKDVVMATAGTQFRNMLDVNKDGKLDREDVAAALEKKMAIVNAKLGSGGFAPGVAGYATFTLGLWRGIRRPKV